MPPWRRAARCANGAFVVIAVGTWKSGVPRRPGEELRDVHGPATAEADDAGEPRLAPLLLFELLELEAVGEVDARQVRAELVLESGPQVRHRHDEVRPMREVLQLPDELATEDGLELAARRQPTGRSGGRPASSLPSLEPPVTGRVKAD